MATINSIGSNIPIEIAKGGTNAASMTNTDGVVYFDGTSLVTTAVGTATHVLTSNGAGVAPTFQAAAGGGITTLAGNTGSATGATVTLTGGSTGSFKYTGSGATVTFSTIDAGNNVVFGGAGASLSGGAQNLLVGPNAGGNLVAANFNVALGGQALYISGAADPGNNNVAIGYQSLAAFGTTANCVAVGYQALNDSGPATGVGPYCIGVGALAGGNYGNSAESYNIVLGSTLGNSSTNNEMHLGHDGSVNASAITNKSYIYGVAGVTTTVADAIPVLISATTSQLGTLSSSLRYKENVVDMADQSSALMKLRPVCYNFKKDESKFQQFGLIAEEVDKVFPRMVIYKDNKPETVRYHEMVPMLLNEIQKLNDRLKKLEAKV